MGDEKFAKENGELGNNISSEQDRTFNAKDAKESAKGRDVKSFAFPASFAVKDLL
jgi:hypothetical protein